MRRWWTFLFALLLPASAFANVPRSKFFAAPDADGNITLVTNVGQASRLTFGFDAYDLMTAFTNADGYVIQYQHDNNGNITVLTYPRGFSVTNYYNALNQLTNATDWLGKPTNI